MKLRGLVLIVGLTLPAITVGAFMNLFSGFSVEREVILDPDRDTFPSAILRAADGGYYVLLSGFNAVTPRNDIQAAGGGGLIKTDNRGQTQWIYREPAQTKTIVEFEAAAAAPDGGVLLCGRRAARGTPPEKTLGGVVLLLDKSGREVSRIDPVLQEPLKLITLVEAVSCGRLNDGFLVIGNSQGAQIAMRLTESGSPLWEKKLPMDDNAKSSRTEMRLMVNGDIAIRGTASLIRLRPDGSRVSQIYVGPACGWVTSIIPKDTSQILCNTNDERETVIPKLAEYDESLMLIQEKLMPEFKKNAGAIGLSRVYELPNGARIIFGTTHSSFQRFIPTILEIAPDQSVSGRYEFHGSNEIGITDGMPTGISDEYVVIRPVLREKANTAMTFLRRN